MYSHLDIERISKTFGQACQLLINSTHYTESEVMSHMSNSECVKQLLDGIVLYATSSALPIALCLGKELCITDDEEQKIVNNFFSLGGTSTSHWASQTEINIAMRTHNNIEALRKIVSSEKLRSLYYNYHVFFTTDIIIDEQYGLETKDE